MKKKLEPRALLKRYAPLLVLILIFSSALWFRSFPARFSEIQALDPFFFYRMGLDAMDNNLELGTDMMRYHPGGIETAANHYMIPIYLPVFTYLSLTAIGMNMHYLHFAIMWSAWLGALAVIPMYLLGKELFSSRKAGLFAAFFLATVPAFITRTSAGFFEKEPIAGVFIISSAYFFVRAFKKSSWTSGILAGLFLAIVSMDWGGVSYIYLLFAAFFGVLFLGNIALLALDYAFGGYGKALEKLQSYMTVDMIKAYLPLVIIGVFVQQPLGRKTPLDSMGPFLCIGMLSMLLIRYGADRFSLVKKEYMNYVIPVVILVMFSGLLVGSMFNDTLAAKTQQISEMLFFGKSVVGSTVAENAPGDWGTISSTTGTGYASAVLPQLSFISPYMAIWILMFLGLGLLIYRFYRTQDWLVLMAVVWLASSFFGVFYLVRLIFLVGPPAALVAGFFAAWVVDRCMRTKYFKKFSISSVRAAANPVAIAIAVFVTLVVTVNMASAYAYSLNLGPSICFPRYNSDNPFDVQPCITIDGDGNEVMSANQPWYEAFNYLANETPEGSSVLSWWDFGYWFQARGQRPTTSDGGHSGGLYPRTDEFTAMWYTDSYDNWDNHTAWLEYRDVDYILMDYTLPGKYGAISKISSGGSQIVGMLQFSQKGIEPNGDDNVYIFQNGQYEIWLPLDSAGSLSGTPMFLITQNGQYFQRSHINDVCTASGIIRAGEESPAMPGCVAISDLGVFYIPPEAERTIFTDLMFMNGVYAGDHVEKVFDNKLVKIYKYNR